LVFECFETSFKNDKSKCKTRRFSSGNKRTAYCNERKRRSLFNLINVESIDCFDREEEKCSLILRNNGDNFVVNKHSGNERKYCFKTSETSYGLKSSN
jgi:hypothetical protein